MHDNDIWYNVTSSKGAALDWSECGDGIKGQVAPCAVRLVRVSIFYRHKLHGFMTSLSLSIGPCTISVQTTTKHGLPCSYIYSCTPEDDS